MSDPLDQLRNVDLSHLSKQEAKEFTLLLEELDLRDKRDSSAATFYDFVLNIWPEFIAGSHHKKMAEAFDKIANGESKRLIINMPPRHTKSEFAS